MVLNLRMPKPREQPFPPSAVMGCRSDAGVSKDCSSAAKVDADRALVGFEEVPIALVKANRQALEVASREIGGLAVE